MSAYEQRVEAPNNEYQYILFAALPYETIAFKIPNRDIDKGEGKFFTKWVDASKVFTLQLFFKIQDETDTEQRKHPVSIPSMKRAYHGRT